MINLQNKKRSAYQKDGDLPALEDVLKDYWDKSRTGETKSIEDLDKYLWLGNAAAVTVSIGYIQKAKSKVDADEVSDYIFKDIRKDRSFGILRKLYLCLQYGAGLAFVGGCV